ncbi:uncharacterized protein KY384_003897 [Bacidia gigantensis]|uniref:uncharacterized protein n=1 Tax=Bacidia gigantensis TaxID=2732470 RepID=UPI001D05577C|nr:uncharacterized protein KY384_003897 [Bacidia gigantensis]KAG8532256.1 hypothetical protein KY384_003897 [Bacidia gigantensis]
MPEPDSPDKQIFNMNLRVLTSLLNVQIANIITVASWATVFELHHVSEWDEQAWNGGYLDHPKSWVKIGIEGHLFIVSSPPTATNKYWRYFIIVINRNSRISFALEIKQCGQTTTFDEADDMLYLSQHAWPPEVHQKDFWGVEKPDDGAHEFGIWIYSDGSSAPHPQAILTKMNFCQMLGRIQHDELNTGQKDYYSNIPDEYRHFNYDQIYAMIRTGYDPLDPNDEPISAQTLRDVDRFDLQKTDVITPNRPPRDFRAIPSPLDALSSRPCSPDYPSSVSSRGYDHTSQRSYRASPQQRLRFAAAHSPATSQAASATKEWPRGYVHPKDSPPPTPRFPPSSPPKAAFPRATPSPPPPKGPASPGADRQRLCCLSLRKRPQRPSLRAKVVGNPFLYDE